MRQKSSINRNCRGSGDGRTSFWAEWWFGVFCVWQNGLLREVSVSYKLLHVQSLTG